MLSKRLALLMGALLLALSSSLSAKHVTLLDFYLPTCGPCRAMAPTVERLAAHGVPVRKVDGQAEPALAERFKISRYPTFIAIYEGKEVGRIVGLTDYNELHDLVTAPEEYPTEQYATPGPNDDLLTLPAEQASTEQWQADQWESAPADSRSVPAAAPAKAPPPTPQQLALVGSTVRISMDDPKGRSYGTGTIIDSRQGEALVVTCAHMFRNDKGEPIAPDSAATVEFFYPSVNGPVVTQTSAVQLLSFDIDADVALISTRPQAAVPTVKVASTIASIQVGDNIATVGCDLGALPSVRTGLLRSHNPTHRPANIVASGAPIQGRSGGGLFNSRGELIGVCFGADQKVDEGLYATLESVHTQLDKLGLSDVYKPASAVRLASATTPVPPTPAPAPAAAPSVTPPSVPISPPASASDPSQLVPVPAPSAPEQEPVIRGQNAWDTSGGGNAAAATADNGWNTGGMSNVERAALGEIAQRAAESEVVLVVRPKAPGGRSEVITLDSVSPQFLQALQAMKSQR